jgi:hypothetical protein
VNDELAQIWKKETGYGLIFGAICEDELGKPSKNVSFFF